MGKALFSTNLCNEYQCLDFILKELRQYPNIGKIIVKIMLLSSVKRERSGALKVLGAWSGISGNLLSELSPELFAAVSNVAIVEIDTEI